MGADKHEKNKRGRLPPFVPLLVATLDTPAWRALSHGAKALYVCLRRRYSPNSHNNGRIYLSRRLARKELRSGYEQIARWYDELQFYGFIRMMTPHHLGIEGHGTAARWRLTELGYMKDMPTRDFLQWDGKLFGKPRPVRPPPRKGRKQNPVMEIHNAPLGKSITPALGKSITPNGQSVMENPNKQAGDSVREIHNRTSLPLSSDATSARIRLSAPSSSSLVASIRRRRAHGWRPLKKIGLGR
jgi:hypothetical protein